MYGEGSFQESQEKDQGCVDVNGVFSVSQEVLPVLKACFKVTAVDL